MTFSMTIDHQGGTLTSLLPSLTNATDLHLQNTASVPEGCIIVAAAAQTSSFDPRKKADSSISRETELAVDFAVGSVCLPLLFVIAVPCNLLNMLVFWKQGLTERVNLCLFYLSLVDFLHMLTSFLLEADRLYPPFSQAGGPVKEFFITHSLMGLQGLLWLSGFIAMLITCERCLCVVSPLRSQTLLSTRTTAGILAVATVTILTCSMILRSKWDIVCAFDPQTSTVSKVVYPNAFYTQNKAHIDVLSLFTATLQPLLYAVVVMIATTVTSVNLKKMVAWREQTSSQKSSTREVSLTRMLIAISVLYVICSIPTVAIGIAVVFVRGVDLGGRHDILFQFLVSLVELASFVNATLNFCVYYLMGSRYRETLCKLCTSKTKYGS